MTPKYTIGIDAHKATHTLVAVDAAGAVHGERTVKAVTDGHAEALRWASKFGDDLEWAVEDCRGYTRLLEQDLLAANQRVIRVPLVLMAHARKSARSPGKSDAIDATAVARAAQRERDLPVAFHDETTWQLKLLMDRRDDLVEQRVAFTNRLIQRLHLIDPARPRPKDLTRASNRQPLVDYLAAQSGLNAELAAEELADIDRFSRNIDALTKSIGARVHDCGSTLPDIPGCAEITAARFISAVANVTRFHSEAAFARYVGVAPQPESSGLSRGRMQLSRGGNRQLNSALHTIAVVQIRLDSPGRRYYLRRIEEGDTKAGARRCLKRKICRVVYTHLRADHRNAAQASLGAG
ncbi:IS110 family transposase [Mycolicibacterium iranicum]|uniref:IS110 family transposase n=1 Tax=Mycolicibacterium iranicum TaxID=912594 RepID=UPI0004654D98|nr:IS110 family transposase [Mycolicibacterium iranicum]